MGNGGWDVEVDDHGFDGADEAFLEVEVGHAPEELFYAAAAYGFDPNIYCRGLRGEADAEWGFVVAGNNLRLAGANLDAGGLKSGLKDGDLHIVGDKNSGGTRRNCHEALDEIGDDALAVAVPIVGGLFERLLDGDDGDGFVGGGGGKALAIKTEGPEAGVEVEEGEALVAVRDEIFGGEVADFVAVGHDLVSPVGAAAVSHKPDGGNFSEPAFDFTAGSGAVEEQAVDSLVENPGGNFVGVWDEVEGDVHSVICATEGDTAEKACESGRCLLSGGAEYEEGSAFFFGLQAAGGLGTGPAVGGGVAELLHGFADGAFGFGGDAGVIINDA